MNSNNDAHLEDFIEKLPKVELHAHLNGCIRETTLFELARERKVSLSDHHFCHSSTFSSSTTHGAMYNIRPRSLKDCFDMFAEIPKCVNDHMSLRRITREALQDFASHHVTYLELRSTPKRLLSTFQSKDDNLCTKKEYIETIVSELKTFERQEQERYEMESKDSPDTCRLPLVPRIIVSIDRSSSVEDAIDHVNLAIDMVQGGNTSVVGVDLGGNPTKVSG